MQIRELTGREKQQIRKLVKDMCANYDHDYGCLPLNGECFMFGKAYTHTAICKWFRNAVMSLKPEIKRLFTNIIPNETKPCKVCGKDFSLNGRQAYCSEKCFAISRRKSVANNVREYRKRQSEL